MNLQGSFAFISGASGGIGLEFARQLHRLGVSVALCARREEPMQRAVAELNSLRTGSASYLVADLTRDEGISKAVQFIRAHRIDVLVNNAGRGSFGEFEELPLEEELNLVQLNIVATLRLAHAAIPQMKARGTGALVSVSSIAAFQPLPFMATYAATKAFNFSHSLALRRELAPFGVRVLTVCPGPTETEFFGVARVPGTVTGGRRDRVEDVVAQSIRALRANRPYVVTGLRSKMLALASRISPLEISTWAVRKMLESPLSHKKSSSS